MQSFPQQPPLHVPSEIDVPQYPSAIPDDRSLMQRHEIVVYPNSTPFILIMIVCGVALALELLLILGLVILFFLLDITFQSKAFVPLMLYLVLMISILVFCGWTIWSLARFLFKPAPLLIINHQGIIIGKMPMLSSFFIPWHDIEAIYTSTFINKYLFIRPKDTKQFLQRFNLLERLNRKSNIIFGLPPLFIAQRFLQRSLKEIMQDLQVYYAQELDTHHIQLHP